MCPSGRVNGFMRAVGFRDPLIPRMRLCSAALLGALSLLCAPGLFPQTSVVTQHNDIARTGQNTNETTLTPANVNASSFGKLFSYPVDGWTYAQPLYLPRVTMGPGTPQAGTTHNVVFVATEHDSVYAFDADSNAGANSNPLWRITLLDAAHGVPAGITATTVPSADVSTGDIIPEIGITSTGVIDPATNTLYIVGKTKEVSNPQGPYIQRLHALDVTTGQEKFGGPVALSASVPGNGTGSSAGTLRFDPLWENNRASLLLLNGIVYIAFASHGDNGPWHGWILAYNASTLAQTGAWCASPNGAGNGIWMSGAGLAADVPDPMGHPFGRMFTVTGNGSFDAVAPNYSNAMDYGDSIIKLDLNDGIPTMSSGGLTVGDLFAPHDQVNLSNSDEDQASGGILLLPDAVGGGTHILTQVGKTARVYVLNQDNLGGYNANNSVDPQQKASLAGGLWGTPAYWNGNLYIWGMNDRLKSFTISNGVLSSTPASQSAETAAEYSPTPSISANGTTNGIVWSLKTDNYNSSGREILYAHDATNVSKLLYSSETNVTRDNPGNSVKFIVPTVVNGRVYAGSESQLSVFGLLNGATQAATPIINPASQSFSSSLQVTITDSSPGVIIYFTTDGSQPTTGSQTYSAPFTVTSTTTVKAIAAGNGLLQSAVASETYTLGTQGTVINFATGFSSGSMALNGSAKLNGTALRLTDGGTYEAASAWYSSPVNAQSFTSDFSFVISGNSGCLADGFTIAWQGVSATALGPAGGGLGYGPDSPSVTSGGIASSVAVKFDLFSNAGEGADSTGLYVNGASPTTPAVDMTGTGIDLQSGHQFKAHIVYDGTNLTMTITDASSNASFTHAWPINIPATVGANTAYVGFTGGTGGCTAVQDILTWTYSTGGTTPPPTLSSISVTPANPSATAGSTVQFHATGIYSDNTTKDLTNSVSWSSSNTSAATVNSSGLATTVTAGQSTTITATSGSVSGSTTLTVTSGSASLNSITVTPANSSAPAGTTVQFQATGNYSDNSTKDITSSVTWSSSNTNAATISVGGLATAKGAGQSTTISATSGGVTGSTMLSVSAPVLKSIAVTPTNPTASVGSTIQFHATGTYTDNSAKDITNSVVWASSNTRAATINSTGLAKIVTGGLTSTISATSGSISGQTTLTTRKRKH